LSENFQAAIGSIAVCANPFDKLMVSGVAQNQKPAAQRLAIKLRRPQKGGQPLCMWGMVTLFIRIVNYIPAGKVVKAPSLVDKPAEN
jgi:hypothetical protein